MSKINFPFPKSAFRDVIIGVGFTLLATIPSYYFWKKIEDLPKTINSSSAANASVLTNQAQKVGQKELIIAEVGKLMRLPKNESPVIATVTDSAKIREIPFFNTAKEGQKILIYAKAQKAILYDPKIKKIISAGPMIMPKASTESAQKQATESGKKTTTSSAKKQSD